MPCSKCDDLKSEYESTLAKLRESLAKFEDEPTPTWALVDQLESDRQAFESVRRQLEEHLQEHSRKL